MEYEITMKVKVPSDFFYFSLNSEECHAILEEMVHNAMHDVDDVKVVTLRTEEVETWK